MPHRIIRKIALPDLPTPVPPNSPPTIFLLNNSIPMHRKAVTRKTTTEKPREEAGTK
jgi:hypothetical protein